MTFHTTTLKSGLRIITIPMTDNPSVTVLVMVRAGSKYETKKQNGLSHFLEHMAFKGTTRRPEASDISRELDSIGAQYNAFTGQEYTGYYAKAAVRHVEKVTDIISDMYLNPIFNEKEIAKEKGVVIEEIRMYKDLPQRSVGDLFMSLLYGDQPVGLDIAGTEENVRSFTKKDLVSYYDTHYTIPSTTIIVSGSFDEKVMIKMIIDTFSKASTQKGNPKPAVKESQLAPAIATTFKETDQTHLIIGFRAFPVGDKRVSTMNVLAGILDGGMSSRLFTKMRTELGICYYIGADYEPFTDHGLFAIAAGVDNSRVEEGIKGILGECKKLKDDMVSETELQKVKDYIAGTMMLSLETSDSRARFYGYQDAIKSKVELPEEMIAKVRAVTAEDVQKLAQEIFVDKGLNMALIGRYKDSEPFEKYFTV